MKPLLKIAVCILLTGIIIFISCKKEYSCESCPEKNKPLIAKQEPVKVGWDLAKTSSTFII
jgi:hypothetical protein